MKLVTVVGADPQLIKAAALSRILRRKHEEAIVHAGQHFCLIMTYVKNNKEKN